MSAKTPVIVVGMHRSGTSALARAVNLLGVDLGPEEEMLEAKEDNPEGFWENRHLVQAHDDLLAELGGRWDEPPLVDGLSSLEDVSAFQARCREIVDGFEGDVPGFKDPRASLLLEFWGSMWPDARVVVCVRHPDAVAASLGRRDGFKEEKSAELWLRYTWDALASARDPIVVQFEQLLDEPEVTLERVATALGLQPSEEDFSAAVGSIGTGKSGRARRETPRSAAMDIATWCYDNLDRIPLILAPIVAAGVRESTTLGELRQTQEDLRRVVTQGDQFHSELRKTQGDFKSAQEEADRLLEELKRTQGDFRSAREEADRLALVADSRLEALEREERAREAVGARLVEIEPELKKLREEVAWRRAIQYRLEKLLGRRGLRFLSGYKER